MELSKQSGREAQWPFYCHTLGSWVPILQRSLTEPRRGALGSVSALESEAGTVRSLLSILQVLNQEQRHHRHLSKLGNNLNQMCAEVHMERDVAQSTVYQEYV